MRDPTGPAAAMCPAGVPMGEGCHAFSKCRHERDTSSAGRQRRHAPRAYAVRFGLHSDGHAPWLPPELDMRRSSQCVGRRTEAEPDQSKGPPIPYESDSASDMNMMPTNKFRPHPNTSTNGHARLTRRSRSPAANAVARIGAPTPITAAQGTRNPKAGSQPNIRNGAQHKQHAIVGSVHPNMNFPSPGRSANRGSCRNPHSGHTTFRSASRSSPISA